MRKLNRRNFLKQTALMSLGGTSMYSVMSGLQRVHAQVGDPEDYRALVCVFLFGGNDSANMIIPTSQAEYATYQQTRQNLAIAQNEILPISPLNDVGADYGLNPNMPELQTLFADQKLSIIGNVGALIEPTTKTQFINNSVTLPPQLFSHNDQQNFVMSLEATIPQQGWASRIADLLTDANINQDLSMNITLTGTNTWQGGGMSTPYSISPQGIESLWFFDEESDDDFVLARTDAFNQIRALNHSHMFARKYASTIDRSISLGGTVSAALGSVNTAFNNSSRLATSLRMVAQLIAGRQTLNMRRQMFFVGIGDYDTHGDQANRHPLLMTELSQSLNSFYNALVELGVSDKVTTFTASDFGRTLTSNGDGTDHAWGGHQLVMGDHVDGGKIFGTMPSLALNSDDDIGEGRIIPTLAMDQYAATLSRWYGLSESQITEAFPNLVNFNSSDIGFLPS